MKILLGLALAAASIVLAPSSASADAGTARILIVGDSVTQGKVGDYTWRYRLWTSLQVEGRAVDFVGPHTGLFDPTTTTYDNAGYADPNFDQDHAAWWGLMLSHIDVRTNVHDLMTGYSPDVVIDELGVNDLIYGVAPSTLIDLQAQLVADVRAVNPSATVVIGQITQTWFTNAGEPVVDQYNALVADLVASLDQPGARVIMAVRPADYSQADTWDTSHPNAGGEVKIAEQYGSALGELGLPSKPAPTPPPAVTYAGAARLAVAARPRAARLAFTTPEGATRQAVWKRDVTARGHWHRVAYVAPSAHVYRAGSLRPHHRYAFQLRAYEGPLPSTRYSNRVALRVR